MRRHDLSSVVSHVLTGVTDFGQLLTASMCCSARCKFGDTNRGVEFRVIAEIFQSYGLNVLRQ